jgi:hypothetical protein
VELLYDPAGPLSRGEVDLDVDEDHDAAGDVEGPERRVQDVADVLAQLKSKVRPLRSLCTKKQIRSRSYDF